MAEMAGMGEAAIQGLIQLLDSCIPHPSLLAGSAPIVLDAAAAGLQLQQQQQFAMQQQQLHQPPIVHLAPPQPQAVPAALQGPQAGGWYIVLDGRGGRI